MRLPVPAPVIFGEMMAALDAVEIAVMPLDVEPGILRICAGLLSEDEQQRARRFAFDRDRCRFTVGRARLRQLLGARLSTPPEHVELVYGAHGKPALSPRFAASGLRFNVSHCDDVAAYAFAFGKDVGIDIEAVRRLPDADDVARAFFSPRERRVYAALGPSEKPRGFFNCWTRKEAFIKALGSGLSHRLDRFDVSLAPGAPARILCVDGVPGEHCGWALHDFPAGLGLVGAVVVQQSPPFACGVAA